MTPPEPTANNGTLLPPDARTLTAQAEDTPSSAPVLEYIDVPARYRIRAGISELARTVLPALLIALLIQLFLAQTTRIQSYSMEPTLFEEQRLVIEKLTYRFRTPERGEIVVVNPLELGGVALIKRVVGLPGEEIAIKNGRVYINGGPLREPYLRVSTLGSLAPTRIQADQVFVMGDNRNISRDSRMFGPVPLENVVGRAFLRYWPFPDIGLFLQP